MGHYTFFMMLRREALAIFDYVYRFIEVAPDSQPRHLPSAVLVELRWPCDVLFLAEVDMKCRVVAGGALG